MATRSSSSKRTVGQMSVTENRRINSRDKGKRGELQVRDLFRACGMEAHRGQQYRGGESSPDVIVPAGLGIHVEVKLVEAGNPYGWLRQAIRDAGSNVPTVFHRRWREEWIVILRASDFLDLLGRSKPADPWAPINSSD